MPIKILKKVRSTHVNAAILNQLKAIWGGDSEKSVGHRQQNAAGVLARLNDKVTRLQIPLTPSETALANNISGQQEVHEAVLAEGRRLKELSPIPADYAAQLQQVVTIQQP